VTSNFWTVVSNFLRCCFSQRATGEVLVHTQQPSACSFSVLTFPWHLNLCSFARCQPVLSVHVDMEGLTALCKGHIYPHKLPKASWKAKTLISKMWLHASYAVFVCFPSTFWLFEKSRATLQLFTKRSEGTKQKPRGSLRICQAGASALWCFRFSPLTNAPFWERKSPIQTTGFRMNL